MDVDDAVAVGVDARAILDRVRDRRLERVAHVEAVGGVPVLTRFR